MIIVNCYIYKVHMGTDPQSLNHQLVLAKDNNFYCSLYDKVSRRKKIFLTAEANL